MDDSNSADEALDKFQNVEYFDIHFMRNPFNKFRANVIDIQKFSLNAKNNDPRYFSAILKSLSDIDCQIQMDVI